MRIVLAISGTRGDVQPAVVLGHELRGRGHDVVAAVPPNLTAFAASAGLPTADFGYDTREHMNSDLVRFGLKRGSIPQRIRALAELRDLGWDQAVRELTAIADGADALVTGVTTEQVALPLAERGGASLVALQHAPIRRNGVHSPIPGAENLPSPVTRATWTTVDRLMWLATSGRENTLRRDLGLPAAESPLPHRIAKYGTEIQAYDRAFCPALAERWEESRPFTGFLEPSAELRARFDGAESVDPAVVEWMAEGAPPVYVGFGSMPVADPSAVIEMVLDVCDRLGERALISLGWNERRDVTGVDRRGRRGPSMVTGSLDHQAVFPRCKAVVHHGGAGSTAAGIRAGRPTLVCSVGSDQPFWGARVREHGAGEATTLKGLDAATLEAKLRVVLGPDCERGAAALSAAMESPRAAVTRAADLVEASVTARRATTTR